MFRTLLIGLWVTAIALGSTYAGAYWKTHNASERSAAAHAEKIEVKKVKPITAPVIVDGQLKGYVSAEFSYAQETGQDKHGGRDPEAYFIDEAFRLLYSESSLDFEHVEKIDLDSLTRKITDKVNARMGSHVLKETLVKNLVFTPREGMPH